MSELRTVRMIDRCRACGHTALSEGIDLGDQYLSDFRLDSTRPPRYPLHTVFCDDCALLQLTCTAPPAELYHDRYSFKSGISEVIRADLASVVATGLTALGRDTVSAHCSWLDIASNDGTLLSHVPAHIERVGIDPLPQLADEARRHASEVIVDFFDPRLLDGRRFDVITSVSMFYDLDDPNAFVSGVHDVLDPDGVWVIQQNYLPLMLGNTSVDNISHEHLTYWSLSALVRLLRRHGLQVNDVELRPVNGGCMRTVVSHTGTRRVSQRVDDLLAHEHDEGTATADGLRRLMVQFRGNVASRVVKLRSIVCRAAESGCGVYVYGASTRGAVLWQAAGLDRRQLSAVVERNPAKVGRWMSAIGVPIISEARARIERPEYMLVGPWWLRDQVIARELDYLRRGGRLIFPLPDVEVIGAEDLPETSDKDVTR